MKTLGDGADEAGADEFGGDPETRDDPDAVPLGVRWKPLAISGDDGAPHARVRYKGSRVGTADVRAAVERFDDVPDNGRRWN